MREVEGIRRGKGGVDWWLISAQRSREAHGGVEEDTQHLMARLWHGLMHTYIGHR